MKAFVFDNTSNSLYLNRKRLGRLNSAESAILKILYARKGRLVERQLLLEEAWQKKIVSPNSVSMAVKNIRACFEAASVDDAIITHVKMGFSWNELYSITYTQDEPLPTIGPQSDSASSTLLYSDTQENNGSQTTPIIASKNAINSPFPFAHNIRIKSLKKTLLITFLIFSSFYLVIALLFFYLYWPIMTCTNIDNAIFCGVGELNKGKIPSNIAEGKYIYGYTEPTREFRYEKIQ